MSIAQSLDPFSVPSYVTEPTGNRVNLGTKPQFGKYKTSDDYVQAMKAWWKATYPNGSPFDPAVHKAAWDQEAQKAAKTNRVSNAPGAGGAISTAMQVPPPAAGGVGSISGVVNQLQGAQNQANQANENRYNSILGSMAGMGGAERGEIAATADKERGAIKQHMLNMGLNSSTVVGPMMNKVTEQQNSSNMKLADSLTKMRTGVMERRSDVGPDAGLYSGLIQKALGNQPMGPLSRPGSVQNPYRLSQQGNQQQPQQPVGSIAAAYGGFGPTG